jgi:dethiobiotin synthetase
LNASIFVKRWHAEMLLSARGLFIAGTDTDVGKTQVTCGLYSALRTVRHSNFGIWKPVQTGVNVGESGADSYRLKHGSGISTDEADLVSFTFSAPLAPWMASMRDAVASGGRIGASAQYGENELLAAGQRKLAEHDFLFIEGAGGVAVPLTERWLTTDFIARLGVPAIVVARPGLGTVNHTLLTVQALRVAGVHVLGVILNGLQIMDEDVRAGFVLDRQMIAENVRMIETFGVVPVLGVLPWLDAHATGADWSMWRAQWTQIITAHLNLNPILDWVDQSLQLKQEEIE